MALKTGKLFLPICSRQKKSCKLDPAFWSMRASRRSSPKLGPKCDFVWRNSPGVDPIRDYQGIKLLPFSRRLVTWSIFAKTEKKRKIFPCFLLHESIIGQKHGWENTTLICLLRVTCLTTEQIGLKACEGKKTHKKDNWIPSMVLWGQSGSFRIFFHHRNNMFAMKTMLWKSY